MQDIDQLSANLKIKFEHWRENMPASLRILHKDGMILSREGVESSRGFSFWLSASRDSNKEDRFSNIR
jgi:hypothetical protein